MSKLFKKKQVNFDFNSPVCLSLQNINYTYQKNNKKAVNNLNLTVQKGSFTSIMGPNGCGKSTTAKSIVKLLKPSGLIEVFGVDLKDLNYKQLAQMVAYIPQSIEIPQGTRVIDFITYGRNPYLGVTGILSSDDKKIIEQTISSMQITDLKEKFMHNLSGGERQKVLLALCIVQNTPIILLDEPTTYLDIKNQYELLESLKQLQLQEKKTIIAILHDLNQAVQYSDYVYFLKDGSLFAEGKPEVIINSELLHTVYGIDATIPLLFFGIGMKRK